MLLPPAFSLYRIASRLETASSCAIISISEFDDDSEQLDAIGLDLYDAMEQADRVFKETHIQPTSVEDLRLGVVCDGKIVGASTLGVHRDTEAMSSYTFSVAVLPAYRRKGLARRLVLDTLEIAISESSELGTGGEFRVWVINPHMAKLLESLGFEPEGQEWTPSAPHMTLPV